MAMKDKRLEKKFVRLLRMIDYINNNLALTAEEIAEYLGEYVRYHILNSFGIQSVPVRGIEGRDGEITKIEGIRDEVDYNLTIEGDGK